MNAGWRAKATFVTAGLGLALTLAWLASTQGPLAPTKVTLARVEEGALVAGSFGIGSVEARRSYALGPTVASRVARVLVDQGDTVKAGQLLAELDPVDLDERVAGAQIAVERAASAIRAAEAQLAEARSRAEVARASARRYAELRAQGFVSKEAADTKEHDSTAAQAAADAAAAQLAVTQRDRERARADMAATSKLRAQARLASPVDGVVSARLIEPGTTIVAGQAVLQVIDPASLWFRARFDQGVAGGLRPGQAAEIVLRSEPGRARRGWVERVDLVSDAVTEERIVNVAFAERPERVSVGELGEVTIRAAELTGARWVPAAAVKRVQLQTGVWQLEDERLAFRPVKFGITTLDGRSQVLDGLPAGAQVVVHSERELNARSQVRVVPALLRDGS